MIIRAALLCMLVAGSCRRPPPQETAPRPSPARAVLINPITDPDLGYAGWLGAFDLARDHHAAGTVLVGMKWSMLMGTDPEIDYAPVDVPFGQLFAMPEYSSLRRLYSIDFTLSADRRRLSIPGGYAGVRKFTNPDVAAAYVEELAWFADRFPSDYLAIGVEVNDHYDPAEPAEWAAFIEAYRAARIRIKASHPALKIFVYWQWESLNRDGAWGLLTPDLLADNDVLGLSSYPAAAGFDAASLPGDYYLALESRYGRSRPVLFAELGHPSAPSRAYPGGSPAGQAAFVARFFELIGEMNVELVSWTGLHDASWGDPFFDSIGLRSRDGTPKEAWTAWIAR